jgi:hypothetical protein
MPDKDKENNLNFKASLALASTHYKINWLTCSNVVIPSSSLNFEKLGNSITSRVRELVIVIGARFLIDVPLAIGFYVEGFSQNSSQLIGQVIRIRTRLECSTSGCYVNWLWSKIKLWRVS